MRGRFVVITLVTVAAALIFGGYIAQCIAIRADELLSNLFN